jgi:hypothetical protein
VSLSGGYKDSLVWTALGDLTPAIGPGVGLALTTSAIRAVGFSVDHQVGKAVLRMG